MVDTAAGTVETPEEIGEDPPAIVRRWNAEIALAEKAVKDWWKSGEEVVKAYRDDYYERGKQKRRFNIVFSNTETLAAALFDRPPPPLVSRKIVDSRQDDKPAREVSTILERGIAASIEDGFEEIVLAVLQDYLLPGRGVARIRYTPTFGDGEREQVPVDFIKEERDALGGVTARRFFRQGEEVTEVENDAGELAGNLSEIPEEARPFTLGAAKQVVVNEEVRAEYVYWQDYLEGPARTWAKVPWVSYRYRLTRSELVEQFGKEIGNKVSLDWAPSGMDKEKDKQTAEFFKKATVREIWDKDSRKVIIIVKSFAEQPLAVWDDPLGLEGFFPNPEPLDAVTTTDRRVPRPFLAMYRDQADELNNITGRIDKLVEHLKVRGAFDKSAGALETIMKKDDGEFVGVDNMSERPFDQAFWMMPLGEISSVLQHLYVQRDQVKQAIFEITGLSDILRGSTDPKETLGAQTLKARFGALRHQRPQNKLENHIKGLYRLMGEVIAEKFSQDTLARMTGVTLPNEDERAEAQKIVEAAQANPDKAAQVPPEMLKQAADMARLPTWDEAFAILRDDGARAFAIDIETENTALADHNEEQKRRIEALTVLTEVFDKWFPAVQAGTVTPEFFRAIVMFLMRPFRVGRELEDALDDMMRQLEQAVAQSQQGEADKGGEAEALKSKIAGAGKAAEIEQRDRAAEASAALGERREDREDQVALMDATKTAAEVLQ